MLSDKILNALNKQIEEEFYSSNLYLAMASWCDKEGLSNCAAFMYDHFEEEKMHMLKFMHYINEVGGHAIVPMIKQPPTDFDSVRSLFKDAFVHEQFITSCISNLAKLSSQENDFQTLNFLQWFITEQIEEETTFQKILDKIKLIGDSPSSLYFIEQEIEKLNAVTLSGNSAE
ncbi:MAG: ferritin [Saprospiraceae bacterium]|nr:ferritin [Saprospiraceae bacterium]